MAYPQFHEGAEEFVVMTDASATGIGAVLEQGGRVVVSITSRFFFF